jgi:hypothetical protein
VPKWAEAAVAAAAVGDVAAADGGAAEVAEGVASAALVLDVESKAIEPFADEQAAKTPARTRHDRTARTVNPPDRPPTTPRC